MTTRSNTATYHTFALFILILTITSTIIMTLNLRTLLTSLPTPLSGDVAGIQTIRSTYSLPFSSTLNQATYPANFTAGIRPLPLQSHNDFEREHPLFDALAVGCTAFAADLPSHDYYCQHTNCKRERPVYVGHSSHAISEVFTLQNLYLDPLLTVLEHANTNRAIDEPLKGVYDDEPMRSVILLLDFKDVPSREMWDVVLSAVRPLMEKGFLTFWSANDHDCDGSCEYDTHNTTTNNTTTTMPRNNGTTTFTSSLDSKTIRTNSPLTGSGTLHVRPLTLVGTGSTSFPFILHASPSTSHRYIFMDAPLLDLLPHNTLNKYDYDTSTTFSASVAFHHPLITLNNPLPPILGFLTNPQRTRIRTLIKAAEKRGLKSRFWGIKGLPVCRRRAWRVLVEEGVGLLVVDEIGAVAGGWRAWGWKWVW